MLDRTLPYVEIVMKRPKGLALPPAQERADGFFLRRFMPGDEAHWARIETSVTEFPEEGKALEYFAKEFAPQPQLLRERMCFACAPDGEPVATCTAWEKNGQRLIHWVATVPEHQRKGLARFVTLGALRLYPEGEAVYLHTQTWSHAAMRLYHELGFCVVKDANTEKALDALQNVYEPAFYSELVQRSITSLLH